MAQHNGPDDCWVSFLGDVYDITPLLRANDGVLTKPLYGAAGTDISHWFDAKTRDVRTYVDPTTNVVLPYYPQGRFLHCPPPVPTSAWDDSFGTPWWKARPTHGEGGDIGGGVMALRRGAGRSLPWPHFPFLLSPSRLAHLRTCPSTLES